MTELIFADDIAIIADTAKKPEEEVYEVIEKLKMGKDSYRDNITPEMTKHRGEEEIRMLTVE